MRPLLLTLTVLLLPVPAQAQGGYVCMSAFAWLSPQFPRAEWLAMHRDVKRPCLPVLLGTFGEDLTPLHEFTDAFRDRPHAVHVELSNETARNNQVWYEGELLPGFPERALAFGLERYVPLAWQPWQDRLENLAATYRAVRNPNTRLIVTLGLESDFSPGTVRTLAALVRSILPPGTLIANYERLSPGVDLRETHGRHRPCNSSRCVVNEDGARTNFAESARFLRDNRRALLRELWIDTLQGRRPHVSVSREVPPRARTFRINPATARRYGRLMAAQ